MRRLTSLTLAAMLASCAPAQEGPPPTTREQAIRAVIAEDLPLEERVAAAHGLGRAIEHGDYAAWERVRLVVESESAHPHVRLILVDTFAQKADERIAEELLSLALGWEDGDGVESVDEQTREAWGERWQNWSEAGLLGAFLRRLSEPPLRELVSGDDRALRLIECVGLTGKLDHELRNAVHRALSESRARDERKGPLATRLIVENAASGGDIYALVGPEDLPQLRDALEESGSTADTMHWNAMMALGYIGDVESRELFLAKKRAMDETDPKQAQMIRYYLWQIEVQNPPEGLLEHIAQPTDRTGPHNRGWAIRRAQEVGLPREDIRRAIFTFAKTVKPERRKNPRGGWMTLWPELASVKATAVELGIMSRDELPQVPYSDVKPMQ